MTDEQKRWLRIAGYTAAAIAVAGGLSALLVRDQIGRQQRNLFHSSALRRMGALEHISRQEASVDLLYLLRDYIAWEPRKLLRNRARTQLERVEQEVRAREDQPSRLRG